MRKVILRAIAPRETREGLEDQEVALDLDQQIVVAEETAIVVTTVTTTVVKTIVKSVKTVAETDK